MQSNVMEPGENPGRLRHCNGPHSHEPLMQIGKAGRASRPKSGYRFGCARRLRGSEHFSVIEKDEAGLSNCFRQDSLDAFILRLVGYEGFFNLPTPGWSLNCKSVPQFFAQQN
jgi:hypothetical protein